MLTTKIFVDTKLLMLLVVGATGKQLITKHKRLQEFEIEDYEKLLGLVTQMEHVLITPNILTETSNLLAQHREPERSHIFHTLRALVREAEEVFVDSETAANNDNFIRLGLTDAALLEVVSKSTPLITTDLKLYLAALQKDKEAAFNFNHFY